MTLRLLTFAALLPLAGAHDPKIVVHLAGDSTMAAKRAEKRPETGWGEFLQEAFDSNRVRVVNHAQNGRSTRTFIEEGRWQTIVDSLRRGDYVFIQFGHNDQSKDKVDRYTAPAAYQGNLRRMVKDARSKGGRPVLLTPVMRRRFDSTGTFYDVHGEYPDLVRAVAAQLKVPLIDMHRSSKALLTSSGSEPSRALFLQLKPGEHPNYPNGVDDNTHFSPRGARLVAALAIADLRRSRLGLARFLLPADSARSRVRSPALEDRGRRVPAGVIPR